MGLHEVIGSVHLSVAFRRQLPSRGAFDALYPLKGRLFPPHNTKRLLRGFLKGRFALGIDR